jgi:mono/diheme cytochrome c family protein
MRRTAFILVSMSLALAVQAPPLSAPMAEDKRIEHGQYLVMHVAMCVQCHTPRTGRGELDQSQLLQGAPMPIESPFPTQTWAFEAPKIAGLPGGWTVEGMIQLLQTGKSPGGQSPRPPMPPFRMHRDDAEAIALYLRSLQ